MLTLASSIALKSWQCEGTEVLFIELDALANEKTSSTVHSLSLPHEVKKRIASLDWFRIQHLL
eukprot:scaffold121024_cov22-Tisochrysis_lutea.AAC.1